MKDYGIAIVFSLVMHGALVAWLGWGFQAAPVIKKTATPNYVEAKLVKLETQAARQQKAKAQKVIDLTAQRREQARREAEARKVREKKLAQEKAAKDKAAREKAARDKAAAEKARQERELKQKQAAEDARRQRESALLDALEEEDEFLSQKQDAEAAQSYVAAIRNRIEMNWSRPPSARNGMSCELLIQLVPTGRVIDVKVVRGSGNSAFDRSAEQAVKKAERFPELVGMDPQIFERNFRQFRLKFEPEDLRQ